MYKVLLADDEDLEREALRLFITESKLPIGTILEAATGNETIEISLSEKPDIIVLDINMPGQTGLNALKKIREQKNKSKVIISTAFDRFDYAIQAIQLGVIDFLVKPVSQNVFIESIKKTIESLEEEKKYSRPEIPDSDPINNEPAAIQKACEYIQKNYAKKIGLCDIANYCGYSKFHLSRIFKTYKNMTIIDYLIAERLLISKKLLVTTNNSIKHISSEVGFSDPNYFTWTFKKIEGISPIQFRENNLR